jgi:phospholipase C
MPTQEPGTRPHRPTNYQLHADVTVNRTTSKVTAALTNTGKVGASFSIYPDELLTFAATPVTVLPRHPGSYVWDAALTGGRYAFLVYGPDGFLTSFAGTVVPAGQNNGQVPAVTAALRSRTVEFTLASEGRKAVTDAVSPNDYVGSTKKVTVPAGNRHTVSWPTDRYGYDVVITANTRRRIPPPLRGPHRLNDSSVRAARQPGGPHDLADRGQNLPAATLASVTREVW